MATTAADRKLYKGSSTLATSHAFGRRRGRMQRLSVIPRVLRVGTQANRDEPSAIKRWNTDGDLRAPSRRAEQ